MLGNSGQQFNVIEQRTANKRGGIFISSAILLDEFGYIR